jgi:hypothetical protein
VNPGLTIIAQALRVADHIKATELRVRGEVERFMAVGGAQPVQVRRSPEARP